MTWEPEMSATYRKLSSHFSNSAEVDTDDGTGRKKAMEYTPASLKHVCIFFVTALALFFFMFTVFDELGFNKIKLPQMYNFQGGRIRSGIKASVRVERSTEGQEYETQLEATTELYVPNDTAQVAPPVPTSLDLVENNTAQVHAVQHIRRKHRKHRKHYKSIADTTSSNSTDANSGDEPKSNKTSVMNKLRSKFSPEQLRQLMNELQALKQTQELAAGKDAGEETLDEMEKETGSNQGLETQAPDGDNGRNALHPKKHHRKHASHSGRHLRHKHKHPHRNTVTEDTYTLRTTTESAASSIESPEKENQQQRAEEVQEKEEELENDVVDDEGKDEVLAGQEEELDEAIADVVSERKVIEGQFTKDVEELEQVEDNSTQSESSEEEGYSSSEESTKAQKTDNSTGTSTSTSVGSGTIASRGPSSSSSGSQTGTSSMLSRLVTLPIRTSSSTAGTTTSAKATTTLTTTAKAATTTATKATTTTQRLQQTTAGTSMTSTSKNTVKSRRKREEPTDSGNTSQGASTSTMGAETSTSASTTETASSTSTSVDDKALAGIFSDIDAQNNSSELTETSKNQSALSIPTSEQAEGNISGEVSNKLEDLPETGTKPLVAYSREIQRTHGNYPLHKGVKFTGRHNLTGESATADLPCYDRHMRIKETCPMNERQIHYLGANVTFEQMTSYLIQEDVVYDLVSDCEQGTWCLPPEQEETLVLQDHEDFLIFCSLANCLQGMRDECMTQERRLILGALMLLCRANTENYRDPCLTSIKKMIHVTLANIVWMQEYEPTSNYTRDVCGGEFIRECTGPCVDMGMQLHCMMMSCDYETEMFAEFGPWRWYFEDKSLTKCSVNETALDCGVVMREKEETPIGQVLEYLSQMSPALLSGVVAAVLVALVAVIVIVATCFLRCIRRKRPRYSYSKVAIDYADIKHKREVDELTKIINAVDSDEFSD